MRFPSRLRDRPYLLLTLTSLFWAGNAVVGRATVKVIPPIALAEIRWTLAFLVLLPFVWTTLRNEMPTIRKNIGILSLLAATSIGAFNTLLYWSLQHTTAINATLMQSTGPLLIGLWSFALFREPLTRRQICGICISLVGIVAVVSSGTWPGSRDFLSMSAISRSSSRLLFMERSRPCSANGRR